MNVPNSLLPESVLFEIERHINNYFNDKNDPDNPQRDYPDAFLELAAEIADYIKPGMKTGVKSETNFNMSYSLDLEYSSWQKAFARELAIYKRAKFI